MARQRIPRRVRQNVAERAGEKCEYCQSPLRFATEPFAVEHIVPVALGGSSTSDNLAFSCSGCNGHKHTQTEAWDPLSQTYAPLFHPRRQNWADHFTWDEDFVLILGLTPTGRATVGALHMNRTGVVELRRVLFVAGVHPFQGTDG